jgi:DNA-binding response OmpR family regulator
LGAALFDHHAPRVPTRRSRVHLLVLTNRADGATALLPSLEYLGHEVQVAELAESSLAGLSATDAVLIDATQDLRAATGACRSASLHELRRPVVLVIAEGALAAVKSGWGFHDWVLPDASPGELETRLRLVAEQVEADTSSRATNVGGLVVDEDSYQVRLKGRPLDLTYKEFELIKTLASSPNRVFTRELLLSEIWGYDYFGGSRTIDVHVRRLRAKLGPEYEQMIVTVRGVGYKLVPPGQRQQRGPEDG